MLNGKAYTKQQVSIGTGLSVATCNTLLNDMTTQGIVLGGSKQSGDVGGSSVLYQINGDHECYLALHFYITQKIRWIEYIVFSARGKILSKMAQQYDVADYKQVESVIAMVVEAHSNLTQIIIGTPSIAQFGIIKHCDIPELKNVLMKKPWSADFLCLLLWNMICTIKPMATTRKLEIRRM